MQEKMFYIPDKNQIYKINLTFIKFMQEHPEYFFNDRTISSVYGCPMNGKISGGRAFTSIDLTEEQLKHVIDNFKNLNIDYSFTFTNLTVKYDELKADENSNILCKVANYYSCCAVVASEDVEKYLTENYPNIKLVSSTTKCLSFEDTLKELESDKYKRVVVDIKHYKKYNDIPQHLRDKCEILVNERCPHDCPFRKEHYIDISNAIINKDSDFLQVMKCRNPYNQKREQNAFDYYKTSNRDNNAYFNSEQIDILYEMGYSNFKLEGRMHSPSLILNQLIDYLVKPECKYEVLSYLCSPIIDNSALLERIVDDLKSKGLL